MKPRKTPPTRGLVAVVWHALFVVFICCGTKAICSGVKRREAHGKSSPARKSDPQSQCAASECGQSTGHIEDRPTPEQTKEAKTCHPKHRQKNRACESDCQNMPQWAAEALGSINRQDYTHDELRDIASRKLHLALYAMMTWPTTNRDWKKSTPQYVLTFLGKTAEELSLRPSYEDIERADSLKSRQVTRKGRRLWQSGWLHSLRGSNSGVLNSSTNAKSDGSP